MFSRVTLRVTDFEASSAFYGLLLPLLGIPPTAWDDFAWAQASAADPATSGLHIGFAAASRAHVDAFWEAGTNAGYRDDGPPGPRPQYTPDYYGAFLLDPDRNSAEAVHHAGMRTAGMIDHLWIRVDDVAAEQAKHESAARRGHSVVRLSPDHVIVRGPESGSLSYVTAEDSRPTRNVDIAFIT